MSKTALVLSGGGAKGMYQVGAEKVLREEYEYEWDVIAGISAGSLNAFMISQHKQERLKELLMQTTEKDIMDKTTWIGFDILRALIQKRTGLYSNDLARKFIEQELEMDKIDIPFYAGYVNLNDGEYYNPLITKNTSKDEALTAIHASTIVPATWGTVKGNNGEEYVDGGVRNYSLLGDVISEDPDEIIIINCSNPPIGRIHRINTTIDVVKRSLEIVMSENFKNDLDMFLTTNNLVEQAKNRWITLRKKDGTAYKYFDYKIISPQGYTLGTKWDEASMKRRFEYGQLAAREAMINS